MCTRVGYLGAGDRVIAGRSMDGQRYRAGFSAATTHIEKYCEPPP